MANKGWVKLYRKFLDSKEWTGSTSAQREVFIVLLLLAAHEPHKMYIGQEELVLQPGQVFISVEGICKYIGRLSTRQKTRGAIDKFCKSGFLTKESTSYGMLITIVNWDKYQSAGDYGNQVDNHCTTMRQPPHNQVVNHKQEDIKNDKECKNVEEVETRAGAHEDCCWYYQNRIGMVNPTIAEDIMTFESIMPGDLINAAIDEAARNNARWSYAKAILQRCKDDNILTLDAFNADKKSKSTRKSSSPGPAQKSNYDSRSYDDDFLNSLYKNGG